MHIDEDGNPIPGHVYTARELASIWNDNRETLAGTWVWEEGDFSIHFDANGGTGSMTDQAVTSDDPFNLDKCEFLSRNPQKTFVGWATSRNGRVVFTDEELVNVTNYYISNAYGLRTYYYSLKNNEGQSCSFVKKSSNSYTFVATLYAVYAPDSYTINYQLSDDDVAEGARGSMRSESAKSGEEHDIAANKFSKKGYYVAGWKVAKVIDQNGSDITSRYSGKTYGLGATIGAKDFMGGDKVTLQPIWKSNGTEPGAEGGEIIVKLKGGEAALIENQLPAGTEYEIWEETPDGWVLVYPGNNDAKGTIVSNETSEETFVNKYDPQPDPDTTITLVAHKLLQNEAGEEQELREGQFRFQLREGTDLAVDPKQTVTNAADGTVTFKPIGYTLDDLGDDESKEFTYTITEVKGSNDNIEYASDPITVTVTVTKGTDPDTGDATLTATAAYSPEDATFVNIVKEPVTHTLTIQKVAEGASADTTFTFEVSLTDAKGQKLPAGTLLTVDGDDAPLATAGKLTVRVMGAGSVIIGNIPNGTQYSVSETSLPNGWAFVSAEGDSGTLQGEEPQAAEATITNEYTPTGKVTFKAYKTFEDSELAAGDFVFELRDPSGTVIQQKENGAPSAGVAPITFDSVELTAAGDYTYTITEVTGNDATIEYDDTEVTASFTMTDNGDGTLTASEVTYSPENATFVNTKKPGELKITKAIEGAAPNASTASFSVVVTFTDAEGTAVAGDFDWTSTTGDSGTVASGGTLTIHGDETVTVAGLPGGTHYTAVEDTEAAKSQGFVQSGITGDEGTIAAGAASEVEITNTYLTATTATIKAVKQLEGRKLTEGEFTFHLKDADGNVIAEAENDENGNVTFPELTYSYADEDKTFTYTVSEVVPAEADRVKGMTYDETEHEVTVTIAKGDDGELTAKVNYADDEVPTFVNTYEATGKAKVEVTKELVGADISQAEGQFEFTLARPDGDVLSQAEAKAQAADGAELKATNDASGKVSFREITYDQDDAGKTYTYVVRETKGKDSGITYDAHACTVRVKVTDNGNGTLSTDVTYGNSTFKNTYNYEPDYGDLEIIKTLKTWENSSVAEDGSGTINATFVFDVKATLDGEVVYSNAVAVHFNGPGSESAVIKHLPAGASVVVTERYSGATYELKSELEQTTTIVANDMVSVGFKNDYTTNRRGGHGVTNQFTYEGDGKWDNVSVYGGSANAPETQQ